MTRAPGAVVEIGDNVGISGATIYARKGIYIGENTCIGGNCKILIMTFTQLIWKIVLSYFSDIHGGDSDLIPTVKFALVKIVLLVVIVLY